jgi:hypothetical protein
MKTFELQGDTAIVRNDWLRGLLHKGTYDITFTKINGETRIMPCTLESSKLPPVVVKENATAQVEKVVKPDSLCVWCIDKQEWRSFRVMSVTNIKESAYGK